jgi:hypothetical protein
MNPDVRYWHLAAIRLARSECPLLGVERTSLPHRKMSAFDPKRTFAFCPAGASGRVALGFVGESAWLFEGRRFT